MFIINVLLDKVKVNSYYKHMGYSLTKKKQEI